MNIKQNIHHYGDILAIPFFLLLSIYFYNIESKTPLEYILFVFSIVGFLTDSLFTIRFIRRSNK